MKKILFAAFSLVVFTAAFAAPVISQADYQASYAKASALADKALAMQAGWTVTEKALQQAQQAAAKQDFDQAVVLAQHAEALAQASIRQSVEQRTAWRAAVVK